MDLEKFSGEQNKINNGENLETIQELNKQLEMLPESLKEYLFGDKINLQASKRINDKNFDNKIFEKETPAERVSFVIKEGKEKLKKVLASQLYEYLDGHILFFTQMSEYVRRGENHVLNLEVSKIINNLCVNNSVPLVSSNELFSRTKEFEDEIKKLTEIKINRINTVRETNTKLNNKTTKGESRKLEEKIKNLSKTHGIDWIDGFISAGYTADIDSQLDSQKLEFSKLKNASEIAVYIEELLSQSKGRMTSYDFGEVLLEVFSFVKDRNLSNLLSEKVFEWFESLNTEGVSEEIDEKRWKKIDLLANNFKKTLDYIRDDSSGSPEEQAPNIQHAQIILRQLTRIFPVTS